MTSIKNATLFDNTPRINMRESIALTVQSLQAYGERYDNWAIAWSGGKDSTATVTLINYLIDSGQVKRPNQLRVFYADTRMELLPLYVSAADVMDGLAERGIEVVKVMAPMEKRFLPYILGRGVPPPNNNTFRWCTRQIKVDPMKEVLQAEFDRLGQKFLTITGVRQGESAIRDSRIVMSCSKDGAECGQGWYQQTMPEHATDTLAPLLHWRVCHIWEWLKHWAPLAEFGDWDTALIADAYGGVEAEEINARTGCVCCPLAQRDSALDAVIKQPKWSYLAPLKELRAVYDALRLPQNRHRQTGEQRRKDGSIPKNPNRMGALTMEARMWAFAQIEDIQARINIAANKFARPLVDIINAEEIDYIEQCWRDKLYPNGWTGNEPTADLPYVQLYQDGSFQPLLFGEEFIHQHTMKRTT